MKKSHRLLFREVAQRITGISTPVFGVSWKPPESTREIVRRLVAFLEDRRALYADFHMEYGLALSPDVRQPVKTLVAVRWKILDRRNDFTSESRAAGEAEAGSAGAQPAQE